MRSIVLLCITLYIQNTVFGQHQNIMISNINSPQEPTICLNYFNPEIIVAGANLKQYCYSHDGGLTWKYDFLKSTYGVWGDPTVVSDRNGIFYFFHLSRPSIGIFIDRIVCQKSLDNGVTWNNGSFIGLNGTKAQDKQWATIDFNTGAIYVTWTQFDEYGTSSPSMKSNILFSKSLDQAETWSTPKQINNFSGDCRDSDQTTEGAVPAVGPNGDVYVAWANNNNIYFDRSTDHGETWLDEDIVVSDQPGGWDYRIPGIARCNGLPITCCDTSQSTYRGTIYVNWTDQRNGESNTDVWLAKSTDGGNTWSRAKRVNDDTTQNYQFFTWMTIDQANGNLYFVFYDRRNYTDNYTDVYMALSKDGGDTFTNFQISEKPFYPINDIFIGDYNNITAYNNIVRPIWTQYISDGEGLGLSIWTALIDVTAIGVPVVEPFPIVEEMVYPNPANEISYFAFKLNAPGLVNLSLFDSRGDVVKKIIENEIRCSEKYIEPINLKKLNLAPGIYYYRFWCNQQQKIRKLVVIN